MSVPLSRLQVPATHDAEPATPALATEVVAVPSTEAQREVWLASALATAASQAFNLSISLGLRGPLLPAALRAALQDLVDRHQSLRAHFSADGTRLLIAPRAELGFEQIELVDGDPARVAACREACAGAAFDLARGPLLRACLLRFGPQRAELVLTAHHAVCDGWSIGVIVRELAVLYAARVGAPRALPAAPGFAEFARAQAAGRDSDAVRAARAYWLAQFADGAPALELPTDRPRPRQRDFRAGREERDIVDAPLAALRRLAAGRRTSLFAALLAAWATLLGRLAGSQDVVVAVPAAGQVLAGADGLVGHCVNLLPLRLPVDPAQSFDALLGIAQGRALDAFEHQQLTLGALLQALPVSRDPGRPPLASVAFNLDRALDEDSLDFAGLAVEFRANPRQHDWFDLSLNAVASGDRLLLECQYNRALFDAATIRHWLQAFEQLLRSIVDAPDAPLGSLRLVDATAWEQLRALQPPARPHVGEHFAHALIDATCRRAPQRRALRAEDGELGYGELYTRSNQLAHLLRARGLRRGDRVGLCLSRGVDLLPALLAVLKCGAAYLPLDPQHPPERLAFMLRDAGVSLLLAHRALAVAAELPGVTRLWLDDERAAWRAQPDSPLEPPAEADPATTPAYVIYTSGSTGQPKGVVICHAALVNLLRAMAARPGLGPDDRQLALSSLSFDMAVQDLLVPLAVGAEIVLATAEQARDARALRALLETQGITALEATPTSWRMLLDAGFVPPPKFRALAGGEALSADLAARMAARGAEVWNCYGPTETTVHATVWRYLPGVATGTQGGLPIGTPIDNTQVWVLDEAGQPCPIGMPGELCIGGAGVALGYLNRPELNAERFLRDPFAGDPAATGPQPRLYRSGDRGRWRSDGLIEHLGRIDQQVKLRGYRIELGEIEARLAAVPGVAECVVQRRDDPPAGPRLVAWLVPRDPATPPDPARLRAGLKQFLPGYMVPQQFVLLAALPRLASGKLDRGRLPAPSDNPGDPRPSGRRIPDTPLQALLHGLWRELLGHDGFDVHDSFFELGGHSLMAVRLFHLAEQHTGVNLPLATLYHAPTIAELAGALASAGSRVANVGQAPTMPANGGQDDPWRPLVPIRPARPDLPARAPLFLIHSVGGNVMNYRVLARALPADLPVYGLQAVGLDGVTAPLTSIAAMAARYLDEILAVQPRGPYRLGGGSMGGVIAFEVARRLRALGQPVELLLMFDSAVPDLLRHAWRHGPAPAGVLRRMRGAALAGPAEFLSRSLASLSSRGGALVDRVKVWNCRRLGRPVPHSLRYRHLEAVNRRAFFAYRPADYDGSITLFLASDETDRGNADPTLGWSGVVGPRVRVLPVRGTHEDLIAQPGLASALALLLDVAGSDEPAPEAHP